MTLSDARQIALDYANKAAMHLACDEFEEARTAQRLAAHYTDLAEQIARIPSPSSAPVLPAATIPAEQDVVLADRSAGSNHRDGLEVAA